MIIDAQTQSQKLAYEIEQMEAHIQSEIAWLSQHENALAYLQKLTDDPEELLREILQLKSVEGFSRALRSLISLPIALVRLEQARKQLASLRGQIDDSRSP